MVEQPRNYPNPMRTTDGTYIAYTLSKEVDIKLYIYDLTGRLIYQRLYPAGTIGGKAGYNEVFFSGVSDLGEAVSNGVCLYAIVAENKVLARGAISVLD